MADDLFEPNRAFEASCRRSFANERWDDTLIQCERWQDDEPFASEPRILGSFVAVVVLEDFVRSERFFRDLDIACVHNFTLLNNLAFAEINLGKLKSAHEALLLAKKCVNSDHDQAVWSATMGLLEHRRGHVEAGRRLYRDSRNLALKLSDQGNILTLSSVFGAFEELRSSGSLTLGAIKRTEKLLSAGPNPVNKVLLERLRRKIRELGDSA